MRILLPIAGININILLLIAAGGLVGTLSGLLGVGGGFLLTPILMMIGVPPTIAAASDTNAIVATSMSGVSAHFRLKNVDIKMGSILLVGGLCGSAVGVQCIKVLKRMGNADLLISLTYIIVLGFVGTFIIRDSISKLRRGLIARTPPKSVAKGAFLSHLPFQVDFPRSGVRLSLLVPLVLCALVGVLTSVMGVGGGFMMVPMMVYMLRMPAHVAVGTDLFQILFTCAGATIMQATTNHTVDLVLALFLAAGSTIGAQIGARLSRRLRGEQLMIILGVLAIGVMLKMVVSIALPPSMPISVVARVHFEPIKHVAVWLLLLFRR